MTSKASPDPLFTLRGEMEAVHSVHYHLSDGTESLYAATQNGFVHRWNLKDCREENRLEIGKEACLAVKNVSNKFICQMKGGELKIYEDTNGCWNFKTSINTNYWGFCKIQIHKGLIICPGSNSKIKIMSYNGSVVETLSSRRSEDKCGEIMALKCFSIKDLFIIFALFESGVLTLFNSDGKEVSDWNVSSDCPMALDFDGSDRGIVGGSGQMIVGFRLTKELQLEKWKEVALTNPGVGSVAIRPDGKLFAAGCWDARIRLFSMKSLKLLAVLDSHKAAVQDVCFSLAPVSAWHCKYLLAAAGQDGRVTLWNLYS